jgi:hypothetical protein
MIAKQFVAPEAERRQRQQNPQAQQEQKLASFFSKRNNRGPRSENNPAGHNDRVTGRPSDALSLTIYL